jgi:ATP-dependent DNA helicase DinG
MSYPTDKILGKDGLLAHSLEDFEFRPSQIQMAQLINDCVQRKDFVIIEAGTGTGKTLGYLVPLVQSGKKTVISTGTKNLQEQIFLKDIPLLEKALDFKIDSLLMKGRTNYLCRHKYLRYISQSSLIVPDKEKTQQKIEEWLKQTEFADRAELHWLTDDNPLWENISATSEQCLGSECMHFEECYLNEVRKRAAQSRIIIVNHHLFFADLKVKKGGFGEIIPRFQVAVFDEAHKLEEIATTYFGESLSTSQLLQLIKDVEKEVKGKRRKNLEKNLDLIRKGVDDLIGLFHDSINKGQMNKEILLKIHDGPSRHIRQGLNFIQQQAALNDFRSASFQNIANRAEEIVLSLEKIFSFHDPNWLDWYERQKRGMAFHTSPLDISQNLQELLYDKVKSIIFTSATLSTNGRFDYIRTRLGLRENIIEDIYPSHFDFKKQALLYIPKDLPLPNEPDFSRKVADRSKDILKITSGRALILFTSYNNLNLVHQILAGDIPYTIYKQGDAPKTVLLERFRQDTHSVLLATGSFWQGVDVPGESLSCLIIDKLPFDSPGDPLVAARIDSIKARKGNPFMEYQLPSAIISLKQGLGRLIRQSSDKGVLAIMDMRIVTTRYGRFFLDSLPPVTISHELNDMERFFERKQ